MDLFPFIFITIVLFEHFLSSTFVGASFYFVFFEYVNDFVPIRFYMFLNDSKASIGRIC